MMQQMVTSCRWLQTPHPLFRISKSIPSFSTLARSSKKLRNRIASTRAVENLKAYSRVYNDTLIPAKFQVPESSEWPTEMWGDKIGLRIATLRSLYFKNQLSSDDIKVLEDHGMTWEVYSRDPRYFVTLCQALEEYKKNFHTTSNIPLDFTIPHTNEPRHHHWSKAVRGIPLGYRLKIARNQNFFNRLKAKEIRMLENAGIIWNAINSETVLNLVDILRNYKKLHGNTNMSINYIITSEIAKDWPEEFHNVNVGRLLHRARAAYKERTLNECEITALEDVGIQWVDPSAKFRYTWINRLADGMQIYRRLFGTSRIPKRFVVPTPDGNDKDSAADWPVELHGDKLGQRLKNALGRKHAISDEDKELLEAAGIHWQAEK